ncbi:glycosyltransferase family protein [Coleofasciculus sp. F4-SAH-05]|uniref:glycosyltransferase family protein n=1 Tax=Coleofasciculus sp. F4-SAH-05 TaxID=3069525 RepID=UPI0040627C2D
MIAQTRTLERFLNKARAASFTSQTAEIAQHLHFRERTSRATDAAHTGWFSHLSPAIVQPNSARTRKLRVVLYSHDTMGLGHKRRNLLMAQTLAQSALPTDILLISGMSEASNLHIPDGVDYVALPALHKGTNGEYQSRRLDLSLQHIVNLRANIIRATVESFQPDVFIVDNVPRGAIRELDLTLEYLHTQTDTRCVLGLRDVLDDPIKVQQEWQQAENEDIIRKYYDAVWIYGDPRISDLVQDCQFSPDIAAKVRYTGCFDQRKRLEFVDTAEVDPLATLNLPPGRLALCMVGGGQDGDKLAETFAQVSLPPDTNGVILTGPFMPLPVRQHLHQIAAKHPRLRVLEFLAEPTQLLNRADCVITMGGYNTTYEVLSFDKPALIVPRVKPRQEQLIRAKRLQDLGLIDMLHPDEVTPTALSEWLSGTMGTSTHRRDRIDFYGLARLPHLLESVIDSPVISMANAS